MSPEALLVALGVPSEVQQQLSPQEVAQLQQDLRKTRTWASTGSAHVLVLRKSYSGIFAVIVPMGARRAGQMLEQQMSEYDAEQIRQIQRPTLVLHARDDTLVAFEQAEFAAKQIPNAQLIPMEKGGHLALMMNQNAGATGRLLEFLEQYNRR